LRKIPKDIERMIFQLWLEGHTYREVIPRCGGVSLATISKVVENARKTAPDIDTMRQLNLVLKKGGISVYDAMRGGSLLNEVARLGVSLDGLEDYINATERISSEKEVEVGSFVDSVIKMIHLEAEAGKAYEDVLKDFEGKLSEIANLEAKMGGLKGEIQKLTEARVQLEADLTKGKGNLTQILQELKRTISAEERLERVGLEKLNNLAKFTEDFEALGFNAEVVRDLAKWRKSLTNVGIDPNGLKRFVEEKGPLDKQISGLKREVESLKGVIKMLEEERSSLLDNNPLLSVADLILKNKIISLPCKKCGWSLPIELDTQEQYNLLIRRRWGIRIRCPSCNYRNWFDPRDVMIKIGWMLLPSEKAFTLSAVKRS
jgi:prefoldin subunit 5